jgi:hypothetical protein
MVLPSHPIRDDKLGAYWYNEQCKVFVVFVLSENIQDLEY